MHHQTIDLHLFNARFMPFEKLSDFSKTVFQSDIASGFDLLSNNAIIASELKMSEYLSI
jgi:hypothetical protein